MMNRLLRRFASLLPGMALPPSLNGLLPTSPPFIVAPPATRRTTTGPSFRRHTVGRLRSSASGDQGPGPGVGVGVGGAGGGGGAARSKRPMYAILVDAENAQSGSLEAIMEEIVSLGGDSSVRRVYGDFTRANLMTWKQTSLNLSFLPVNAFSYVSGKGSSDAAMIIEAMELLYTNPTIDGFALVSSDSDFTRLAQRLREAGKHVIGFGQRHTPTPFVTACERFIYTENLGGEPGGDDAAGDGGGGGGGMDKGSATNGSSNAVANYYAAKGRQRTSTKPPLELLHKTVEDAGDEDGWAPLSSVGDILMALKSDFDVRSYGYRKLSGLFRDNSDHFQLRLADDNTTYFVRNRKKGVAGEFENGDCI